MRYRNNNIHACSKRNNNIHNFIVVKSITKLINTINLKKCKNTR